MTRTLLPLLLLLPASLFAQSPADTQKEKAHARSPKQIVFQNDSQWEDNRWQKSDVGPFLAGSITTGKGSTLKGIAIRVGDNGEAAVCFDTARMRISAAWTGDFLTFNARRFGLIRPPAAAGEVFFSTSKLAGWAKEDRFKPNSDEIAGGIEKPGQRETRLPKSWAWYQGLYTSGQRVVLSYSVGETKVLESPWYIGSGKQDAFIRSLEIGPSAKTHRMLIADSDCQVAIIGDKSVELDKNGRQVVLEIPPHDDSVRVKVLIAKNGTDAGSIARLRNVAGKPEDLARMIQDDAGRWPDALVTKGEMTESGGPYVIDTITLPFENPWKALFFTAGHDFFADGKAAICTVQGDVWTVTGVDRQLEKLAWRRFATGLHQPLGLKIVDDKVYVIGRNQITRLHDRNGDGEADFYENFNNDMVIAPKPHDFVTCLDTDPEGNFYFIHATTGVMKVSADGSTLTSVADGFRNPNGMGVGPDGTITAAPQQGTWTPESSLIVVKEGGYYGFGGPRVTKDRPAGWDLPMCFIPRSMDNSGGGQVWVEGDRWGPLAGKMLHLSYGQCRMLLALTEEVDGMIQGGTLQFPTTPGDFESGIMRGRFSPHDGQLYVSGLRGWQSRAIRDGCFQRVRYTGGPVHLPVGVKTYTNGIKLTFTEPLEKSFVENPGNYFVEQWNYHWSKAYGSPDFSIINPKQQGRDEVPVVSATVTDDGRSIFLEMPARNRVNQIQLSWLLRSDAGHRFRGSFAHTINRDPFETFPEETIVRRKRSRFVTPEVEQRLKPGLEFAFRSLTDGESDRRIGRLFAIRQSIETPPTPFLTAGPFELAIIGTLQVPMSGFYDFKITGTDRAELRINDELIVDASGRAATDAPLLLFKGHNRVRVTYTSPKEGQARLQLLWKGHDFEWEPVPPTVLFHDSGSEELVAAQFRRLGRELFSDHHCSACHQTDTGRAEMFELSLHAPDLSSAGDRFNSPWLRKWLLSPASLRSDTHMPAVLGEGEQAAGDAADIAAFLLAGSKQDAAAEVNSALEETGERLYEQQACLSCHHFEPPEFEDEFRRLSLYYAAAKYRPGAISRFLKNPAFYHNATRMPNFRFSDEEAWALAAFVRSKSKGAFENGEEGGNPARGQKLFAAKGCQQCHAIEKQLGNRGELQRLARRSAFVQETNRIDNRGCLSDLAESSVDSTTPRFSFPASQRNALREFMKNDLNSLNTSHDVEISQRLFTKLRCANCHDRDGRQSHRALVIAEEGGGTTPEVLPELTWSGEKLRPAWTESLLAGKLTYKSRPWLKARMPDFPAYATRLAHGLAAEHAVDVHQRATLTIDATRSAIGQKLTLQTGLDCRQCHGIGNLQPRGDEKTKIALGINLTHIRDRMRPDAYQRFMLDPPRYDIKTKMIRLSQDGRTTKLKGVLNGNATEQFDAVWHYIQGLPDDGKLKKKQ